jgi:serine/threonine-protein kinase
MDLPAPVDPLFLSFQAAVAGRYSIDREIGRGGMGIVYLAREVLLDRPVAIKLLPPERAAHSQLRERFLREARLAAKLSHPNIIPIHAVLDTGEFVFYVMAFVDGETLAHRVRTRGPLPGSEGVRILRDVAWALAYAHAQGVIHRDVKPDNILLEAATGRVLVADFGIAAAAGDTSAEGVSGTPEFMSPEQALGATADARSDLYGLGATAFYALSGRFPFEGATATEVLAKQITAPPPALASLGLAVPRKIASLVDRCLAKAPEQRPAGAQALAEQLSVALEQRRELPAPLRAFVKRSGRLNGAGTLLAGPVLLIGATGVAAVFGAVAGFTTLLAGTLGAPLTYFVGSARRLLRLGFTHQDLEPAFKSELEQAREELTFGRLPGRSRGANTLGTVAIGSGALFALSIASIVAGALLGARDLVAALGPVPVVAGGVSLLSTIAYLAIKQRHHDVDTGFWSRLWTGGIGKLAFSIARRLLGTRLPPSAMTHRATELSLGMAAEQLYESLPRETRTALSDVPAVLRRLQEDAQLLRKHYDELNEVLSDAGDAAASVQYAEVRRMRDDMHARISDVVGALETIRLNLLRLHAGSATVEGVTTHIGLAAEVSEQVGRLIAAHEDVEKLLQFPRLEASTPV